MRRKNPHPKRAVNARTVLKVSRDKEEEEVEEEEPLVLCLKIPDEDDDLEANHHQIQKEEEGEEGEDDDVERLWRIMCVPRDDVVEQNQTRKDAKGVKRKRGHECDFCEKVFRYPSNWPYTCVLTRTRNRTNVMCARSVLPICHLKPHAYSHERETVNVMCARSVLHNLVLCKPQRIHTNEKPYECHVCEKRYRQSSGLKYHMRAQH